MKLKNAFVPVVGAAILGLGTGCKDYGSIGDSSGSGQAAVKTDQKQAEDSFAKAGDAQKKASREQDQATRADKDVEKARDTLAKKEQNAVKQKAEASQAQASAAGQAQQAQATGAAAQQRAQQDLDAQARQPVAAQQPASAQQPGTTSTNSGGTPAVSANANEQSVTGKVAQARADSITLDANGQPQQLKVDSTTSVTLDGRPASASQLQQGADVRASFRVEGADQRAIRIDATSKAVDSAGASGSSGTAAQPMPSAPADSQGTSPAAQPAQPTAPVNQ